MMNSCSSGSSRTMKTTPQISEPLPNLPNKIIVEILYKLPVKSLLKFRCVCKDWLSLIFDSRFVKTHLRLSSTDSDHAHSRLMLSYVDALHDMMSCSLHSLLYEETTIAISHDCPLKGTYGSVQIMGSCNGLVCIAIEENLFLWNPSTRKSRRLPVHEKMQHGRLIRYGFGFDKSNDDYKVVSIFFVKGMNCFCDTEVIVYTVGTHSWRQIQGFPGGILPFDSGKFTNGALHWPAGRAISTGSSYSWVIVALDLATKTYGEIVQPSFTSGCEDAILGVLGESLCILCCHSSGTHADLWVMKEYSIGESWTKLAAIQYCVYPKIWFISTQRATLKILIDSHC